MLKKFVGREEEDGGNGRPLLLLAKVFRIHKLSLELMLES